MPKFTINNEIEILVELHEERSAFEVSGGNESQLAEKSATAFNNAMSTIYSVAKRTSDTIRAMKIVEQPDSVEMTFGLKLTSDAKALIVNAGVEAQIEVKLVWNNEDKKQEINNE